MATPTTIITAALKHLGVLGAAESTVDAGDATTCLDALKSLLDSWNLNPRDCVGLQELTYTPAAGSQSFTIGPAGNITARQPVEIVSAIRRVSNIDAPMDVIEVAEWSQLPAKTTQAPTYAVALNRGDDEATVYIYPAADGSTQIRLWVALDVVGSFDTLGLATSLTLPNGYQNALEWCLAEEVSAQFSVPDKTMARVIRKAGNSKRRLQRANARVPQLVVGETPRDYEIESGPWSLV